MKRMPDVLERQTGLKFCVSAFEARELYREIFIADDYPIEWERVPAEPVVLDIGANVGMFASYVLSRRPAASIFCVEPAPQLAAILRSNFSDHPNVAVVELFAGSVEGNVEFNYFPNCSFLSGAAVTAESVAVRVQESLRNWMGDTELEPMRGQTHFASELSSHRAVMESLDVKSVRTEALIELCGGRVDVMKVDVEGAELEVLRGIGDTAWRRVDQVTMEPNMPPGDHAAATQFLRGQGLTLLSRDSAASVVAVRETYGSA